MKIAAGVILIIAAVFNLFAGLAYLGGGAAVSSLGDVSNEFVQNVAAQQSGTMSDQDKQEFEAAQKKIADAQGEMSGSAGVLMAFGVFLLVSVGILIAGAVFLFMGKKASFIMAAGGIAILAEVIGILMTTFGVTNVLGLVGGVLAIIAAKSISASGSDPAAA